MDIHKPKPWHGVREFLKEYVIIVVGVLTALGAEQVASWLHDRHLSAEARATVLAEINLDVTNLGRRLVIEPCVSRKLAEIDALLDTAEAGGSFAPPQRTGLPTNRYVYTQRWEAATAGGRTSLLTSDEQREFARVYNAFRGAADAEDRERLPWAHLHALQGRRRLSPEMIYGLRMAAAEAEAFDAFVREDIGQAQYFARQLGVKADAQIAAPPTLGRPTDTPSICVPLSGVAPVASAAARSAGARPPARSGAQ